MKFLFLFFRILSFYLLLQLVQSCAEPSMPQGGPKDTRPPAFSKKRYSTPNEMTNFEYKEVILTFDEWVKLQNAYSQVVISPPLEERPTIKVKNKSVVVSWKEKLKDSTTYLIQYGESIQDLTEGNKATNIVRVFSTGDFIDSLKTEGQVVDAVTREPQEGVWVMLYQNLADSVPKTQKPYYFTKTNDQGKFNINYIKSGRYQIFALKEKNNNYKFDQVGESIAFLDSTFLILDTVQPIIRLKLFTERPETAVLEEELEYTGQLKLLFNNRIESEIQVELVGQPNFEYTIWQKGDTAKIWFDTPLDSSQSAEFVLTNEKEGLLDTVEIKRSTIAKWMENPIPVDWERISESTKGSRKTNKSLTDTALPTQKFHPKTKEIPLIFNIPIQAWDTTNIKLLQDTTINSLDSLGEKIQLDTFLQVLTPFQIRKDSVRANQLYISMVWDTLHQYQIQILPEGVRNKKDNWNKDTLTRNYAFEPYDSYGDLNATIVDMDSKEDYIIQLVGDEEAILQQQIVNSVDSISITYEKLRVNNYTLRVLVDENKNGIWDTGDYDQKRQPELVINSKPIVLKKGWQYDFRMSLLPEEISPKDKKKKTK